MKRKIGVLPLIAVLLTALACAESSSDSVVLTHLLDEFLAGASTGSVESHERFWAEDLVYTSSNGTRTNKAEILRDLKSAEADDTSQNVVYSAADVDIRIYDDMAIVAFRLIGTATSDEVLVMQYLNTGTFLKRDELWQAVAWQATKIPDTGPGG